MRLPFILFFLSICGLLLSGGRAQAAYAIEGDVVGAVARYTVKPKDTLYKIARQFDVGIVELLTANPDIDPWLPKKGTVLTLPTMHVLPAIRREGIVINLSELRLFYFFDPYTVMTFPIGIGKKGWPTPTGVTTVIKKRRQPVWIPPDSIRKENPDLPAFIPPGPDNPLGDYAMNLGWSGYLIHGTNRPYGVGRRSSHGCIRLYPEDIALLFSAVKEGTPVTVIDASYKLGWRHNILFLEVMPTQRQPGAVMENKKPELSDIPEVYGDVKQVAGLAAYIDWQAVRDAVIRRSGVPVAIATRIRAEQQ